MSKLARESGGGRPVVGRSAEDLLEASCGGMEHHAMLLSDLMSATYACAEEWGYDDSEPGATLARMCRELQKFAVDLSLTDDGVLTLNRECRRCSGNGKAVAVRSGERIVEDPCIECGGSGYVHADEADG